jgi:hypothetical protein
MRRHACDARHTLRGVVYVYIYIATTAHPRAVVGRVRRTSALRDAPTACSASWSLATDAAVACIGRSAWTYASRTSRRWCARPSPMRLRARCRAHAGTPCSRTHAWLKAPDRMRCAKHMQAAVRLARLQRVLQVDGPSARQRARARTRPRGHTAAIPYSRRVL